MGTRLFTTASPTPTSVWSGCCWTQVSETGQSQWWKKKGVGWDKIVNPATIWLLSNIFQFLFIRTKKYKEACVAFLQAASSILQFFLVCNLTVHSCLLRHFNSRLGCCSRIFRHISHQFSLQSLTKFPSACLVLHSWTVWTSWLYLSCQFLEFGSALINFYTLLLLCCN